VREMSSAGASEGSSVDDCVSYVLFYSCRDRDIRTRMQQPAG